MYLLKSSTPSLSMVNASTKTRGAIYENIRPYQNNTTYFKRLDELTQSQEKEKHIEKVLELVE